VGDLCGFDDDDEVIFVDDVVDGDFYFGYGVGLFGFDWDFYFYGF